MLPLNGFNDGVLHSIFLLFWAKSIVQGAKMKPWRSRNWLWPYLQVLAPLEWINPNLYTAWLILIYWTTDFRILNDRLVRKNGIIGLRNLCPVHWETQLCLILWCCPNLFWRVWGESSGHWIPVRDSNRFSPKYVSFWRRGDLLILLLEGQRITVINVGWIDEISKCYSVSLIFRKKPANTCCQIYCAVSFCCYVYVTLFTCKLRCTRIVHTQCCNISDIHVVLYLGTLLKHECWV